MKVILQQDVKGKGKKGQMIEVSDGYGRNYLLPRKLALEATADNVNTMRMNDKALAEKQAKEKAEALELKEFLKAAVVVVKAKGGGAGRLFGSITSAEVAQALSEQCGKQVDKRKIVLPDAIKNVGTYTAKVKLGYEVVADLTIRVEEL
jgi:large subunit ribosomal protein L9